ncbi:hypothetical protein NMY22_g4786 [Coprinellus aureogranulatus]|nr:hypothetical protein NMY22_g4786 [Coprinellus aureogranulatus]
MHDHLANLSPPAMASDSSIVVVTKSTRIHGISQGPFLDLPEPISQLHLQLTLGHNLARPTILSPARGIDDAVLDFRGRRPLPSIEADSWTAPDSMGAISIPDPVGLPPIWTPGLTSHDLSCPSIGSTGQLEGKHTRMGLVTGLMSLYRWRTLQLDFSVIGRSRLRSDVRSDISVRDQDWRSLPGRFESVEYGNPSWRSMSDLTDTCLSLRMAGSRDREAPDLTMHPERLPGVPSSGFRQVVIDVVSIELRVFASNMDKKPTRQDSRMDLRAYEVTHAPRPSPLSLAFPPLHYTIQNVFISLGMLVGVLLSLIATLLIALPLSIIGVIGRRSQPLPSQQNKVVLIVGASRGLGKEIMRLYAGEEQTKIIAVSRSTESLQKAIYDIEKFQGSVHIEPLDLSCPAQEVADAIHALDTQYGPITHAYLVAGITNYTSEGKDQSWGVESMNGMVQVNVTGTTAATMAIYDCMKTRRMGRICIIGSVAGIFSPANLLGYASTKAYLNTFATSLRVLALAYGIDVVCAQPGYIDTQLTQAMRFKPQHSSSTVPSFMFYPPSKSAEIIKDSLENESDSLPAAVLPYSSMVDPLPHRDTIEPF